jgi:hypothetical protein
LCVAGLLGVLLGVQLTAHLLSCVTKIVIHSFVAGFFLSMCVALNLRKVNLRRNCRGVFFLKICDCIGNEMFKSEIQNKNKVRRNLVQKINISSFGSKLP